VGNESIVESFKKGQSCKQIIPETQNNLQYHSIYPIQPKKENGLTSEK